MARTRLDRTAVVKEAIAIADEQRLSELTMAALAKRLGIALPSLYVHVRSLEHLRQLIAAEANQEMAEQLGEAVQGYAGFEALQAFATAYRSYALRFPGRYDASHIMPDMTDPRNIASGEKIARIITSTLRGYGLQEPHTTDAVRMLRSALHGFAALERDGRFYASRSLDTTFEQMIRALDRSFAHWPIEES